jgi:hypothetical protein
VPVGTSDCEYVDVAEALGEVRDDKDAAEDDAAEAALDTL